MGFEESAPCRHRGAPPESLVGQMVQFLTKVIAVDDEYLRSHGISRDEFSRAFPAAIERIRGSWAAANQDRRTFAEEVIKHMAKNGHIKGYDVPKYGKDTVYRVILLDGKQVGIIQKGCPDGAHSSTKWTRPKWADELYLWWLCSSLNFEPGEHIWKGVSRVRKKVSQEPKNQLDGLIFFDQICGSHQRPCPKNDKVTTDSGRCLPPPCIYVFPKWQDGATTLNWRGTEERLFPSIFLQAFGIAEEDAKNFIGYVGFRASGSTCRTEITSRFGPAKATTSRG